VKARKVKGIDPGGPVIDNAERIVAVRLDELCSLATQALDPAEVVALHDARIAAKRLRYVLEVTGELFGPYARTAVKKTKELQDLVGEIHDCDVLEPRLLGVLEELRAEDAVRVLHGAEPVHGDDFRGIELFLVRVRARRQELFTQFVRFWTDLEREGFRSRLEYAISERPAGTAEVAA
jgi:CHAD domain-containing protein